ncbi:MAG: hypothetical protein KDA28_12700, partial [Phycisphaerales bacterium]|nr:hypothetical protein [Phycisphaerales bacterium]
GNPLKISAYPNDADPERAVPDEIFVHAHSSGLVEVFLRRWGRRGPRLFRLVPVDAVRVEETESMNNIAQVSAIEVLAEDHMTGHFTRKIAGQVAMTYDADLDALGRQACDAIRAYLARLEELPDVYRGEFHRE